MPREIDVQALERLAVLSIVMLNARGFADHYRRLVELAWLDTPLGCLQRWHNR